MRIVRPISINSAILTSSNVAEADYSAWLVGTTYSIGDRVIYVDPAATVTITIATPGVITWTAHNLENGQIVIFTTTDTLPTGIISGVAYWVIDRTTDTFKIATKKNGSPIVTTGSQAGTHTATADIHLVFESLPGPNTGNIPTVSTSDWVQVSSTNRWLMFDQSVGSRTSNPDTIDVTLDVVGRVNSVAFLNMSADEVQIIVTDDIDGEIYNETYSLISTDGVTFYYNWHFKPIVKKRDLLIADLPNYNNTTIRVIITDTGNMAEIGTMVLGSIAKFGETQYGMGVGIQDFSTKSSDIFGNTTIVERAFKKEANFRVVVPNNQVDEISNVLSDFRAIPIVYEGSGSFGASLIYGFYKDFDEVVTYHTFSILNIEIEGLS